MISGCFIKLGFSKANWIGFSLLLMLAACKKDSNNPYALINQRPPQKKLYGKWEIKKLFVSNLDSTVYLQADSLNFITHLNFLYYATDEGLPAGEYSFTIAFKRKNDLDYSHIFWPMSFGRGTFQGIDKNTGDSIFTPIRIQTFSARHLKRDYGVLYLNQGIYDYQNTPEGMDKQRQKYFYTEKRINRIHGANFYGGPVKLVKHTHQKMIWEYWNSGKKYRIEFEKVD